MLTVSAPTVEMEAAAAAMEKQQAPGAPAGPGLTGLASLPFANDVSEWLV